MWGGPPGPQADALVGRRFSCDGKAGPGGSGADEGVHPTASYVADF